MKGALRKVVRLGPAIGLLYFVFASIQARPGAEAARAQEAARFDAHASLNDNLASLLGKDVHVHLRSGKTLQGYVKSLGTHYVHLEKLAGRDFYDALARLEDISAVEVKVRDIK